MTSNTFEKKNLIAEKKTYDLIKGDFHVEEASEIVHELFYQKINSLKIKSFSHLIRFDSRDQETEQKIEELREAQKQVKDLIAEAKMSEKSLRIDLSISFELI